MQDVVDPGSFFARALRKSHQVRWRKLPGRRRKHPSGSDIVVGRGDESKVSEHVLNERVFEYRKPRNDKGNLAAGKLAYELVAVTVRAIE